MMNHNSAIDAAEAELQQELREMFTLDTQQHLETYFSLIQQLNPQTWVADIQHLYRAIHTVKGGAVTVAADAMLHAAIVLEDLLSDLRYLEAAPPLADGALTQILLEAGELLSSSVEITETGDRAIEQVQPTVKRLAQLRDRVKQLYLQDWNELKQVHQEFAEQGFDLVVLDLEMALAKIPDRGIVPAEIIDTAQATIAQLTQIGVDLELPADWSRLLADCTALIAKPDRQLWTSVWFEYFTILKACVKNSGKLTTLASERLQELAIVVQSVDLDLISFDLVATSTESTIELLGSLDNLFLETDDNLLGSLDNFFLNDDEATIVQPDPDRVELNNDLVGTLDSFFDDGLDEAATIVQIDVDPNDLNKDLVDNLDSFFNDELEKATTIVQTNADSDDINNDLVGTLENFFIDELDEAATLVQLDADSDDINNDLVGTLENFLLDGLDEVATLVQPEANSDDIDRNLVGTLDNFFIDGLDRAATIVQPDVDANDVSNAPLVTLDNFFDDGLDEAATIVQSEAAFDNINNDFVGIVDNLIEGLDETDPLIQSKSALDDFSGDLVDVFDNISISQDTRSIAISDEDTIEQNEIELSESALAIAQLADLSIDGVDELIPTELDAPAIAAIDRDTTGSENSQSIAATAEQSIAPTPIVAPEPISTPTPVPPVKRSIQIPVPLERLDKSAQQVVDTLLSARAVMNISDVLQSQLARLTTLTRENSQFVTRLRQLQDDYALLRNLSDDRQDATSNVTIERYRQGYTTINRLLENILRLSELGQEIESSTYQSAMRLEALDRSILQLKDGIETSRLVPFRNLTLRAKAILRDLTNRYGKPAELIVENEHIELDAGIVQQLEPALLHLLRNAYDHGLESAQQRSDAGKPAQGKIQISIQNRGNIYYLTIEDDGGGIDANLIHQLAISKGFTLNQTRTNAELLAVLCQPGFSSSSTVSEVSGRGVGMDVVVSQIESINGKLSLETNLGLGTKFAIEVPAPQLLIPCVLFQVGDRVIALPTDNVLETALVSSMTVAPSDTVGICTWLLENSRGSLPGFDLNDYWQPGNSAGKSSQRALPETAICIRTRQAADTPEIWSIADDLLGQAKLLISPLPSPLIAPVGLLGVSLQPDGRLISILDPIALTGMITTTAVPSAPASEDEPVSPVDRADEPTQSTAPTILIVDDAAMIRRRLEASLNNYGFITYTCNDGLEALNWLQSNPLPDLMITDVEMPNMDGFTLIDRARQSAIEIPILVVSSRLSEEWGKEARRLGATDYLNKGFSTSELLQKVNALLGLVTNV